MPRGDSSADKVRACALDLFSQHGVAGTSLRMIAERLGVSKAAVYYHYRSKEDIVRAVLGPAFAGFDALLAEAAELPPDARATAVIHGLARQAVTHRRLYAVVLRDVTAGALRDGSAEQLATFQELRDALVGPEADAARRVRVSIFLAGLVGPAVEPDCAALDDAALQAAIVDAGRRLLAAG